MSFPSLTLRRSQVDALTAVRDIQIEQFIAIHSGLEGLTCFSSAHLKEILVNTVTPNQADSLVGLSLFISAMKRESEHSVPEILKGISQALGEIPTDFRWNEQELQSWDEITASFTAVLESDAIVGLAKFLELSYDYGKLWRNGRIITDVRPIFDSRGESIKSALVSFTFRLEFDDGSNRKTESIALDETDVRRLLAECERALTKSKTVVEFIKQVPTVIAGAENK